MASGISNGNILTYLRNGDKTTLNLIRGRGMSVPGVGKVRGAQDITSPDEKNNTHAIDKMTTEGIPNVGNSGTQSKNLLSKIVTTDSQ